MRPWRCCVNRLNVTGVEAGGYFERTRSVRVEGGCEEVVRVVGRTRARLLQRTGGSALVFDAAGPFAGAVLVFAGQVVYQEVLPLFCSGGHMPDEVT